MPQSTMQAGSPLAIFLLACCLRCCHQLRADWSQGLAAGEGNYLPIHSQAALSAWGEGVGAGRQGLLASRSSCKKVAGSVGGHHFRDPASSPHLALPGLLPLCLPFSSLLLPPYKLLPITPPFPRKPRPLILYRSAGLLPAELLSFHLFSHPFSV